MDKTIKCGIGTALAGIGTMLQTDPNLQKFQYYLTLFLGGLTILIFLYDIIKGFVVLFKKWHKKAMEDGKITKEEWKDLKKQAKAEAKAKIKAAKQALKEFMESAKDGEVISQSNEIDAEPKTVEGDHKDECIRIIK